MLKAGLVLGLAAVAWVAALAIENVLFFHRTGLPMLRTNPLRLAVKETLSTTLRPFYNSRLIATSPLPVYDFRISQRRLEEWRGVMAQVREQGRSDAPEIQAQIGYFPADFRYGDVSMDVDIRSRGLMSNHYKEGKPSLRVKFPKDEYFRGRRVINLLIAYDQSRLVGDTTLAALADQYGFVTHPRRFVVVRVNGEVWGVYHEVEHFRKELAVKQNRSEGWFMNSRGELKGGAENVEHAGFQVAAAAVRRCGDQQRRDAGECDDATMAEVLEKYLDEDKLAVYAALTTWFGSQHAWGDDNLMLFFDPAYGRFEPIPWDVGTRPLAAVEANEGSFEGVHTLGEGLMRLPGFRGRRNRALWEMMHRLHDYSKAESERQYADLKPSLDYDLEYTRGRTERLLRRFQTALADNKALLEERLSEGRLEVIAGPAGFELVNHALSAVEVAALELTDAAGRRQRIEVGRVVPGRYRDLVERHAVHRELEGRPAGLAVVAVNTVTGGELGGEEVSWSWRDGALAEPSAAPPGAEPPSVGPPSVGPTAVAGIRVSEAGGVPLWTFAGDVRLQRSLALPEGAAAVFAPGLDLRLDAGVVLVIRGDLASLGTRQRPITVRASDPAAPFGSFAVLGRSDRPVTVVTRHTTVDGGSEGDFLGVHMSGAFSIYGGSLDMESSRLVRAAGEDGLNVKYGRVSVRDSVFEHTWSDAIDLDFCSGELVGITVRHTTIGDGVDFSGSRIVVRGSALTDIADKGVSAGEGSAVRVAGNRVERAKTGFAAKDLSSVALADNLVAELEIGVAVYQKKPVFGSGVVAHLSGELGDAGTAWLTDPRATLYGVARR